MAVTYYALLTTIGAGKLANATALGTTLKLTQLALGDGGGNVPTPDASRTALVNEVRRAPLNQLSIDPANSSQIIAEQVIPEDVGGWWIREMGLYDESGALIAYANCAPSYKPQLAEGSGRTQTVRMVLIVSNTASVELKIDPSVVLATREYVDTAIVTAINRQDAKASVRVATTTNIALNGLPSVDGVVLVAGDRVLVKNQTTGSQNGIYVAGGGAWARSADADENAEVTPALTVSVESGTAQADSVWQLITDAPIVIGTTALVFQDITNGLARLASPIFTGNPTAPTAAQFDRSARIASTEFVTRALGSLAGAITVGSSLTITAAHAGCLMVLNNPGGTITLPPLADVPLGFTVSFVSGVMVSWPIKTNGSDMIAPNEVAVPQISLGAGDSATLVAHNGYWRLVSGTAGNKYSAGFFAALGAIGYQKLPSGLIIQWGGNIFTSAGAAVTFPIAFPSLCIGVFATDNDNANVAAFAAGNLSKTGFVGRSIAGAEGAIWLALGY